MPNRIPNLEMTASPVPEYTQPALLGVELTVIEEVVPATEQLEALDRQKIYSHQHQDGKVVSGTLGDIKKGPCPMASLPEAQIASVLSLAEMGKAMRAAKRKEEELTTAEEKAVVHDTVEIVAESKAVEIGEIPTKTINDTELMHLVQSEAPKLTQLQEILARTDGQYSVKENQTVLATPEAFPELPIFEVRTKLQSIIEVPLSAQIDQPVINERALLRSDFPEERSLSIPTVVRSEKFAEPESGLESPYEPAIIVPSSDVLRATRSVEDDINASNDLPKIESENSLVMTSEAGLTAADPIEFIVPARHEVVADALDSEQVEFVEQSEVFDETPEPLTETEQMVAVVQGFFEQAAPLISEQILEIIAELPPEESAEIVAQIELLVVVADRLHQLIIEGNETGEEALQIEAFLTREYEQLLVKVGVEPTPEIIAQFMRYIHSDSYNFASAMPVARTEIEDEGTHEKKLFDEAGVFFKAQQASVVWKQNLQTMIGRVSVNNLAA